RGSRRGGQPDRAAAASLSVAGAVTTRVATFGPQHVPALQAFNRRLEAGGAPWRFPESPVSDWLPPGAGAPVWQEYLLLLEDETVRGACALKRQEAAVRGERRRVGSFYWPLSEGAIAARYALVAMRLLRAALEVEPLLFLVGMGGADTPMARLIR